jgi:Ni/Fe-hydrogenase 1 B-type cytochrome subunit
MGQDFMEGTMILPGLHWPIVAMRAVLLSEPALRRPLGPHVGTGAQAVGLVIFAAVAAVTAVHATIMAARRLTGRRAVLGPGARRTVRVWDLGVRVSHWAIVTGIAVLSVTGYYLANSIPSQGHGSGNVTMATLRSVHITFAVLFTVCVLFRIVWFFAGNRWAGWRYWIPTTRSRLRRLRQQAAYYAFVRRTPPSEIGHNALAGTAYAVLYLFFAAQIVTGFALYSQPFQGRFLAGAFGWLVTAVGETTLLFTHGVVMWVILAFLVHHVYSAILIGTEEHSGMAGSIVTGDKRFTEDYLRAAEDWAGD